MTDTITHEVPVRDKIEDWQKIYDRLRDMSEGEIVKYAELLDLLLSVAQVQRHQNRRSLDALVVANLADDFETEHGFVVFDVPRIDLDQQTVKRVDATRENVRGMKERSQEPR